MRTAALLAGIALLVYVGLCAAMFFGQRSLLYFPQATRADAASTGFVLERDGVVLRGWVSGPEDGRPLLYFGGNAERIEANRADFERWFPGHRRYLLAYRGYGASDGAPSADALKADALALYDDVAARYPGRPVDVIGRSVGGGIASHVAAHRPVARLALITPFDRLAEVARGHYPWLPVRLLLRERYDPVDDLVAFDGALLVLRAGRDVVIPPRHTDRLVAGLPGTPHVVVFADAGHNDLHLQPGYGEALGDFFRQGTSEQVRHPDEAGIRVH